MSDARNLVWDEWLAMPRDDRAYQIVNAHYHVVGDVDCSDSYGVVFCKRTSEVTGLHEWIESPTGGRWFATAIEAQFLAQAHWDAEVKAGRG